MLNAIRQQNIPVVKEIVSGFRPTQAPGVQNIAPGRPQSATPPTSDREPKRLAYSKLIEAEAKLNAGVMSHSTYQKIADAYMNAELNGLVDYNR